MSQTFYMIERLEPPFRNLAERSMLIAGEGRAVRTGMQKIVLALGGECLHSFQNETPQLLAALDDRYFYCGAFPRGGEQDGEAGMIQKAGLGGKLLTSSEK
mgnify:CR=1 FL=1